MPIRIILPSITSSDNSYDSSYALPAEDVHQLNSNSIAEHYHLNARDKLSHYAMSYLQIYRQPDHCSKVFNRLSHAKQPLDHLYIYYIKTGLSIADWYTKTRINHVNIETLDTVKLTANIYELITLTFFGYQTISRKLLS